MSVDGGNVGTSSPQRDPVLANIFEQPLVGVMVCTPDGRPTMINNRFCEILGRTADELSSCTMADYTHPDDLTWNLPLLENGMNSGISFQIEKRYIKPDGCPIWCNVHVSFTRDKHDKIDGSVVIAKDISDKKLCESKLECANSLYNSIVNFSRDWISIIDLNGNIDLINDTGLKILGVDHSDQVRGVPWVNFWPLNSLSAVERSIQSAIFGKVARFTAIDTASGEGAMRWDVVISPMRNPSGAIDKILAISRNVTEQHKAAAEVQRATERDSLTDLPNRTAFETRLKAAVIRAMRRGTVVGLLLLDLDYFKQVNDGLGHAAGDHLLRIVGKRLRKCFRANDFVARLGGDEFAIILEGGVEGIDIAGISKSVQSRLKAQVTFKNQLISPSLSIGAATFPHDAQSASELINNADTALFAMKESGRGGITLFTQNIRNQAKTLSDQLNVARFYVTDLSVAPHYQKKVRIDNGAISGFEALFRWRDPAGVFNGPDSILGALKDYELASKIGDLMQIHVLNDIREWISSGIKFGKIAINVAPIEFVRDDFAEKFLARIDSCNVPTSLIEIEVTERVFIEHSYTFVGRALQKLSNAGIKVALDDFGTGYSSISHLRDYPVDILKIDKSFVENIHEHNDKMPIVSSLINLAKSMKIEVVAEGVETIAQSNILSKLGCDMAQGFLFGRPIPAPLVPFTL